jgi:drug/metabolite transporter (DMT)-like permease
VTAVALDSKRYPHFLALIGAALIWSTSFAATKIALESFGPLTLGAVRFIVAALLLVASVSVRRIMRPSRFDLGFLALGGLLGITIYFSLQNVGLMLSTASDAALLVASFPAITMFLEFLIYGKQLDAIRLFGVGLAMIGVYFIVTGIPSGGINRLIGDLLLVMCGVAWAFYNFVTRRVQSSYDTFTVITYQTVAGALMSLPFAWGEHSQWVAPTWVSLLAMFYLGIFASIVAYFLYAFGLKGLDPTTAVTMMNLVPVFGLIVALILLKEHESIMQLLGGCIVIFGVMVSVRQVSGTDRSVETLKHMERNAFR